jgi:hypothetical protein
VCTALLHTTTKSCSEATFQPTKRRICASRCGGAIFCWNVRSMDHRHRVWSVRIAEIVPRTRVLGEQMTGCRHNSAHRTDRSNRCRHAGARRRCGRTPLIRSGDGRPARGEAQRGKTKTMSKSYIRSSDGAASAKARSWASNTISWVSRG